MKKQRIAKVLLSTMIVSSMAASPVFAEQGSTTTTTASSTIRMSFPDVSETHWAMKHIAKLALEGIIEGDETGFRAEDSVSQQDVLIMAIRMMGLEAQAKSLASTYVFPDFLLVDNYARNYVAVALDKGLITLEEEKAMSEAAEEGKTKWGAREASREWVAKIVIRAIGKQALADSLIMTPTSFIDNQDISPSVVGYVNAAVSLQIVNGFEDGAFQPKGAVTRAQMAAFLSRSQKELETPPARVARGYMSSLTNNSITLMDDDGNTNSYSIANNTVFYGNKDDNQISPSAIQETYEVSIVQIGGTAYYVEVLKDELQMDIYEGNLLKLSLSDLTADLYRNDKYEKYPLSPDVTVTDEDGRGQSLDNLVNGSIIELRKSKLAKSDKITSIVVKQVPVNKKSEGTIQSINKDNNQITILEASSGEAETFAISSKVITAFADNSLAELSSLHVGDTIDYDVSNSEVVKIVVKKQADVGVSIDGTLKELSQDKSYVTISKSIGNALASYLLSDNVQVQIDGLSTPSIYDLESGDTLKLDVLNNKVTRITVTDRTIQNLYFSKIVSYDETTHFLTVQDNSGAPHAYEISESTAIIYSGNKKELADFVRYFKVGKRVDMKISKDKVTHIELSKELVGTITQLNLVSDDLTIKTSSGQSLNFKVTDAPSVEIPNNPTSQISDLRVGDPVTALLENDQTEVDRIIISKSFVYKTLLVAANTKKVTALDDSGNNIVFSLDSVPIVNAAQETVSIHDLAIDDYFKLSFKGHTIVKAETVTPIRGKVTAIDTVSSSLTVQDFTGKSQVIGIGSNYAIKSNGGTELNFASIKPGDRVQIMKDANDKMLVQVALASAVVVSGYDNVLNQMKFKSATAGDKLTYNLFSRAYYHKGTDGLSASSFLANDQAMIYVLDGKIVEMEKN